MKKGSGRPDAYRTSDGKRVPGVTTILSRFKEAGGLMHWAWQMGVDGKDYRKERDSAASTGSLSHALIEARVHGEDPEDALLDFKGEFTEEQLEMAHVALDSFDSWASQTKLDILETETPLVSNEYRFGGTLDAIGRCNGKLVLLDWKSSNRIYGEYISQVAAYRQLLAERGDDVDEAVLLRVGKEYGDFHSHYFPRKVLDIGWESFELMRKLYDLDLKLKKVAA